MNERIPFRARKPLAPRNPNDEREVKADVGKKKVKKPNLRKKRDSVPIYHIEQRSQMQKRKIIWYYNSEQMQSESFRSYDDRTLSQNPVNKIVIDKKLRHHHQDNDAATSEEQMEFAAHRLYEQLREAVFSFVCSDN